LLTLTLAFAMLSDAAADDVSLVGKSFELTFIEHQSRFAAAPPNLVDVPGISFGNGQRSQKNRVALTFRPDRQVDYEGERNYGGIFQREPNPNEKGGQPTHKDASGAIGEWFHVPSHFTDAIQMRVLTDAHGSPIIAEIHAPNFLQIFKIETDGVNCRATIFYHLDAGETKFKMFSLKSGRSDELAALSADQVRCSLGTADIF
jgi:hypothetical protein